MRHNKDGIALITAILFLVFMVLIAALVIFAVTRGIKISGSTRREFSAFEAAESGIEWGMVKVEDIARTGAALASDTLDIDQKDVSVQINYMFASPVSGSNIAYGAGYDGIGKGLSAGGALISYRIMSDARGASRENVAVEIAYRKIVGIDAR
ncbi:MAG: PilX N-terminal domain-containing pilus assembly protein [Candidatus Zixiibacteriota bacterium]